MSVNHPSTAAAPLTHELTYAGSFPFFSACLGHSASFRSFRQERIDPRAACYPFPLIPCSDVALARYPFPCAVDEIGVDGFVELMGAFVHGENSGVVGVQVSAWDGASIASDPDSPSFRQSYSVETPVIVVLKS